MQVRVVVPVLVMSVLVMSVLVVVRGGLAATQAPLGVALPDVHERGARGCR